MTHLPDVNQEISRGNHPAGSMEERKAYEAFVEQCTVALRSSPSDTISLLLDRANAFETLGRYREAVADIRTADAIQPGNPKTMTALRHIIQITSSDANEIGNGTRSHLEHSEMESIESVVNLAAKWDTDAAQRLLIRTKRKEGEVVAADGIERLLAAVVEKRKKADRSSDGDWDVAVAKVLFSVMEAGISGALIRAKKRVGIVEVEWLCAPDLDNDARVSGVQFLSKVFAVSQDPNIGSTSPLSSAANDNESSEKCVRIAFLDRLSQLIAESNISETALAAAISALLQIGGDEAMALRFVSSCGYPSLITYCGSSGYSERICAMAVVALGRLFSLTSTSNRDFLKERTSRVLIETVSSSNSDDFLMALRSLTAVLQAGVDIGGHVLCKQGIMEGLMDAIESQSEEIQVVTVEMLSQSCADAKCRQLVTSHCTAYFKRLVDSSSESLKTAGSVALAKVMFSDKQNLMADLADNSEGKKMVALFASIIKSTSADIIRKVQAVEGLAYFSLRGTVKETVSLDADLVKSLCDCVKVQGQGPLKYGIATILTNVTAFEKKLMAEEKQMKRLLELSAQSPKQTPDPLNADAYAEKRCARLAEAGGIIAFVALAKSPSENVRALASYGLCNIANDKNQRGRIVQQGGVKALLSLVHSAGLQNISTPSTDARSNSQTILERASPNSRQIFENSVQALAKIAITMNPSIAFKTESLDLVRPFVTLLDSHSELHQFEALMALTNLASDADDLRKHIYQCKGLPIIENLQFSDNMMIRRAATELLCNMVLLEEIYTLYARPASHNKIHLLLALSDTDDRPTRLAASGALAMLTNSPEVCQMILAQPRGVEILKGCIDDSVDPDMQHRGVECLKNIVSCGKESIVSIKKQGGVDALKMLVKTTQGPPAVMQTALQALNLVKDGGLLD